MAKVRFYIDERWDSETPIKGMCIEGKQDKLMEKMQELESEQRSKFVHRLEYFTIDFDEQDYEIWF